MIIEIPIRTKSTANLREHWAVKAKRAKLERMTVYASLLGNDPPGLPLVVKLTRIAPRKLDSDNLSSSFKAIRDGIADWLQVDDGRDEIEWSYSQQKGKPKQYAIRIEVCPSTTSG